MICSVRAAAQEQAVIGETPNLAARLQGLAEPNTVVIAENTRRLLGGLFDYRDLGTLPVAGIDYPVHVWRVLGASLVGDRFEISLDGKEVLTTTDRSLMLPGAVGVWSQSDSVIYFDSLLVGPPVQAAK